jgi:hypothetical protein
VTLLGIKPGDIDEATGEDLYGNLLGYLRRDAQKVLDGKRDDLSPVSIEWLGFMVDAWDMLIEVRDAGDSFTLETKYHASQAGNSLRRRSA